MSSCNKDKCPCPYDNCENHGKCCACINSHREKGSLVYCMKEFADKDK
ncbi:hypothetical protein R9X47_14785 [Wukongibacter baidiensis]